MADDSTSSSSDSSSSTSSSSTSSSSTSSSSRRRPEVEVLTIGHFTFDDVITGRPHSGIGVVAQVGEALLVRPLADHYVQVDPADFQPLAADDV